MLAETVCAAVSAAGLGIAAVTAYRKRFFAATRIAAYALVPVGLVMTGVVQWIADKAFSFEAWAGFGVLGVAWLLFMATRFYERRHGGSRKERRAAAKAAKREAVAPDAGTPAAPPALSPSRQAPRSESKKREPQTAASSGEDFSDIEAILKKHGI
ncbi:hypothetical protein [Streptomyces sp. NPDC050560]|uniref:hypothetical protein n=1 Tax=Streptomyces sp. NPDC050560 TaxID=3365630 RepID=UPI0037ACD39B